MAFSGTPLVTQVADGLVRIHVNPAEESTFHLEPGASGTIALFESLVAPGVRLPEGFKPRAYARGDAPVSLQDSVQVEYVYVETALAIQPVSVVKSGDDPTDFLITLTNDSNDEVGDTGDLEIYVRFH